MQRNSKPLTWRPKGCSDTIDSSSTFNGSMAALSNLIVDPATPRLFEPRPASVLSCDFTNSAFSTGFSGGFGSPYPGAGYISIMKVIGNYVFGMIASTTNLGHDEPFVFNLVTGQLVPITGVTFNNTPASPSVSGAWTPPQMALIGSKLVVTHPGFAGGFGTFFGYFDISNLAAPSWHGGNCVGAGFPTFIVPPSGVAQFNDRAYFIHNLPSQPAVIFSDVLNPLTNSAGGVTPIITFDDNVTLTAIGGLPLNTTAGGIIQSIMVFKQAINIYQITGDASDNTLAKNSLTVPTGTFAPRTVVPTPKGLAFVSPQGLRIIDFLANVSDPIGQDGQGIVMPFMFSNGPSRMAAGANGTIIRITTQNASFPGTPWQEWWFDFTREIWTGPHTFPATNMEPYQNTFIMTPVGVPHTLWRSDYVQSVISTFTENGTALTWAYATSFLPDTDQMVNCAMTETTLALALVAGQPNVSVTAIQEDGAMLDSVSIASSGTAPLWGTAIWGNFEWGGAQSALSPRQLQWHLPICFARLLILALGSSSSGVKIGALHMRYQITRIYSDESAVATIPPFILGVSTLGGPSGLGP